MGKGNVAESFHQGFRNVDLDELIEKLPYPEMCIICKGVFPETASIAQDINFSFVSLDVDLEKSILEGLRFFYPRMSKHGMIFVHDYRNNFLFGVEKAVCQYEKEINRILTKLPLADGGGTLVVIKD